MTPGRGPTDGHEDSIRAVARAWAYGCGDRRGPGRGRLLDERTCDNPTRSVGDCGAADTDLVASMLTGVERSANGPGGQRVGDGQRPAPNRPPDTR